MNHFFLFLFSVLVFQQAASQVTCGEGLYLNTTTNKCDPCMQGCDNCSMIAPENLTCVKCKETLILTNGTCLLSNNSNGTNFTANSTCLPGLYLNTTTNKCDPCMQGCDNCSMIAPGNLTCVKCKETLILTNGTCLPPNTSNGTNFTANNTCLPGQYLNSTDMKCHFCGNGCANCSVVSSGQLNCTACLENLVLNSGFCNSANKTNSTSNSTNQTNKTCLKGAYYNASEKECRPCNKPCVECTINSTNGLLLCSQCAPGFSLNSTGQCNLSCNVGSFFDRRTNSCIPCTNASCTKCQINLEEGNLICSECLTGFSLSSNICISNNDATCPEGQFYNTTSKSCVNCMPSCSKCHGNAQGNPVCFECSDGFSLDLNGMCTASNSSESSCQDGQFFSVKDNTCQRCPNNCTKCLLGQNGAVNCYQCPHGFTSVLGVCIPQNNNASECPFANYFNSTTQKCMPCPNSCSKCVVLTYNVSNNDSSSNTTNSTVSQELRCLECMKGFSMFTGSCKKNCESGLVYNSSSDSCLSCPKNCSLCYISQINTINCSSCMYGNVLSESKTCVFAATNTLSCPSGQFLNYSSSNCSQCPNSCSKCFLFDNQFSSQSDVSGYDQKCVFCNGKGQYFSGFYGKCLDCQSKLGFGCLSCSNPNKCAQCDKSFVLEDGKCSLSHCQTGYYNDGTGCYLCNSTCKKCYGSTAQNCLDCPDDQILVKGRCQSKDDVQKTLSQLNNSNVTVGDLSDIGSTLSSQFKRNETQYCTVDADCLNNGTCNTNKLICKCASGFWGSNCNFSNADAKTASDQNNKILKKFGDSLNASDSNQSKSVCSALVDMTSVKEINDDQTVNQSLSLLNNIAKNSSSLTTDVSRLMVNAISNLLDIIASSNSSNSSNNSNASNNSAHFRKEARKAVDNMIAAQISNLDNSGSPVIIQSANLEVKITKFDSSQNLTEIKSIILNLFSDQDMDSVNTSNSSNLTAGQAVSTTFTGNVVVNDNFLTAIKGTNSPAVSFTKWTSNPYQSQDNTTISSSVISFSVMSNGSKVNISNLTNPIQIQIPKTKNANANFTFSCKYWNEATSQWSTDGVTLVSESAQIITCNVTHLTDFAGAEVQITAISNSNSSNSTSTTFGKNLLPALAIISLFLAMIFII